MVISENGYALIKEFEGFKSEAYEDSGGSWAYGYGFSVRPDGNKVEAGDTITKEQADEFLKRLVVSYTNYVNIFFRGITLTQNQFDALSDFTYNRGQGNAGRSRLFSLIKINPGGPMIAQSFWDKENVVDRRGNTEPGLLRRRSAESWLYRTGELKFNF